MYYFVSHHGDLVIDPLRDAQPMKRVSDVVRGSHMIDQPCCSVLYRL